MQVQRAAHAQMEEEVAPQDIVPYEPPEFDEKLQCFAVAIPKNEEPQQDELPTPSLALFKQSTYRWPASRFRLHRKRLT